MFSYLDTVKKLVDVGVHTRGLQLYLEGRVVSQRDLTLDFWREYEVKGRRDNYIVKIPVLHLALKIEKFDLAHEALKEVCSCNCEYFSEYGVCKHIIAVCASLEQEFIPKVASKNEKRIVSPSLIDNIFEAELDKSLRIFINNLDYCISKDFSETQVSEYLGNGLKDNVQKYLLSAEKVVQKYVGDYSSEKRMLRIATNSFLIRQGGEFWLNFWLNFLADFDMANQVDFWVRLWKVYVANKSVSIEFLTKYIPELDNQMKNDILSYLRVEFPNTLENWLNFVFVSSFTNWIEENYMNLEAKHLILACKVLPEKRDEYEILLAENMRVWADFLPTGEYQEVIKMFDFWQREIGRSEVFEEALKYFEKQHKRKPKLMEMLQSL